MKHNIEILGRNLNLQPPDAALFVNGLFFDADSLEIGSLLETLRTELRVLDGLYKLSNVTPNISILFVEFIFCFFQILKVLLHQNY